MHLEWDLDQRKLVTMTPSIASHRNLFQDSPDQAMWTLLVATPDQAILPDFLPLPEVVMPPGLWEDMVITIMD
jgi:hypothetical protein